MWSVNSWPKPGASRSFSRSASGTGWLAGRMSKSIMMGTSFSPARADIVTRVSPFGGCAAGPAGRDRLPVWPGRRVAWAGRLAGYSLGDVVADLDGGARRPGALALDQILGDGLLDPGGFGGQAQVLAEHGGGQDGCGRVGLALAGDVRRAAVDRLEHAGRGPLRVDVAARGEPDPAGHRGPQVGEDVAEEVIGDDDVETFGLGDEEHRRGVHVAVVHRALGELLGQRVHGPLPQVTGVGEHVRLVYERELVARPGQSLGEGVAGDPLHPERRVDALLGGDLGWRALAHDTARPGVRALGTLTDDDHVQRLGPGGGERGRDPGVEADRAQVEVVVELE